MKSPEAKTAYAIRRELRLSRQKIAAGLFVHCIHEANAKHNPAAEPDWTPLKMIQEAARYAIVHADILLTELYRTEKEHS